MISQRVRVFVNATGVDVDQGATAIECVRAWKADEADAVEAGTRRITDSRGLPIPGTSPAQAGSIYRTVSSKGADRDA
jgi:hypothetical protein